MFAHGGSAVPLGVYLLRWCGEKENSLAVLYVIFAVGNFLIRGLTRRLRRGSAGTVPWGCKFALADEPRGCRGRAESPCKRHYKTTLPKAVPAGGLTRRLRRGRWDCRTEGGKYFLSKRKKVPKKAGGTATPEAARPAARYSQISAFRALPCPALVFAQACQSLTAYGSCAHWARAPSRPKLRSAVAERLDDPNLFGASNSGR